MPGGTQGTLKVDRIKLTVPFVVRSVEGDTIRMAFELDKARAGKLEQALRSLTLRPAA